MAVALAAALLGAILPLVSHFGIKPDDKAGANVSYVYLANIVGAAAGSLVTGFGFLDLWPLQKVAAVVTVLGMLLMALLNDTRPLRVVGTVYSTHAESELAIFEAARTARARARRLITSRSRRIFPRPGNNI